MAFSESLTIRILGDSSQLRRELGSLASEVEGLQRRLSDATGFGQRLGNAFSRLSSAVRPLQRVNGLLNQVGRQMEELSRQPVTLNVQPALDALHQLLQTAQAVAAGLQMLGGIGMSAGGAGVPSGGMPLPPIFPPRGMASGGLVTGASGIDRIPARLSAGEFVLSRDAVAALGLPFLDRLNRQPTASSPSRRGKGVLAPILFTSPVVGVSPVGVSPVGGERPLDVHFHRMLSHPLPPPAPDERERRAFPAPAEVRGSPPRPVRPVSPAPAPNQTTNHFGGITVQVREAIDLGGLVRDLQQQGVGLRNRRG